MIGIGIPEAAIVGIVGAVVGGVVGGVLLVALIILGALVLLLVLRGKRKGLLLFINL